MRATKGCRSRSRRRTDMAGGASTNRGRRPKPWKVVRHEPGADPFRRREWVYSAHGSEAAARRARDQVRATMARASGYRAAEAWCWSVVHDPDGLLVNP